MLTRTYRRVVAAHSSCAHLMNIINAFLIVTGSHYTEDFTYGILLNKLLIYESHPWFELVEILFEVILLAITPLIIVSHGFIKKCDEKGIYMSVAADIAIVFWSVFYPLLCLALTGVVSPMLTFCVIQIAAYLVIAVASNLYFLKANYVI